jgi:NADH dehydrogenase
VVIIGGGFAGLSAAKTLSRQPVDIILIDRRNHHTFQPLLYQVALGALSASDIAQPLRTALRGATNVVFV